MGDDWQPGDLALCVRGGNFPGGFAKETPRAGQIVTVERIVFVPTLQSPNGCWMIGSSELPPNNEGNHLWGAVRFRKIRPHTPDAEDAETIRLLTGKPAQVPA